jgi:hypothetical protein
MNKKLIKSGGSALKPAEMTRAKLICRVLY